MSYKTVDPPHAPIIKFEKIGQKTEGYFLRSRKGQFGILYDFIDDDGKSFTIKNYADIVQKMAVVPEGVKVKITFVETIVNKQQNPMFIFKIEMDEQDRWNVSMNGEEPPPEEEPPL